MKRFLACAATLLMTSLAIADPNVVRSSTNIQTFTNSSSVSASFQCQSSPTGQCHYIVYASDCSDKTEANGEEHYLCDTRKIAGFALKVGASKSIDGLPKNFRNCMDIKPLAGLPACMANPAPR